MLATTSFREDDDEEEASPQIRRVSSAPLTALDRFYSDSPRSLKRQHVIFRDVVSECVNSKTCKCLKCTKLSLLRPKFGPKAKPPKLHDDMTAHVISRDFGWLLHKIGEPSKRVASTIDLLLPETVILEKGKPRKMYYLGHDGRIQMSALSTAAELFRVLRNFIKLAYRREASAVREAANPKAGLRRAHSSLVVPGSKNDFVKENMLNVHDAELDRIGCEAIEIATLYYHDGAVRAMTDVEAQLQMQGRNKLPHSFWVDIAMLQSSFQSTRKGAGLQYHTYYYDSRSKDSKAIFESWAQKKNPESWRDQENELRLAIQQVPKHVSDFLQKKIDYQVVSAQFEVVRDCADDSLWLSNVSHLKVHRVPTSDRLRHSLAPILAVKTFEHEGHKLDAHDGKGANIAWLASLAGGGKSIGNPQINHDEAAEAGQHHAFVKDMEEQMNMFWASKVRSRRSGYGRQNASANLADMRKARALAPLDSIPASLPMSLVSNSNFAASSEDSRNPSIKGSATVHELSSSAQPPPCSPIDELEELVGNLVAT